MCTEALQMYVDKTSDCWIGTLLLPNVTIVTTGGSDPPESTGSTTGTMMDICRYLPGSPHYCHEITQLRLDASMYPPAATTGDAAAPFDKLNPTYVKLRTDLQQAAIQCGYSIVPKSGARLVCKCSRTSANAKSSSSSSGTSRNKSKTPPTTTTGTGADMATSNTEDRSENDMQEPSFQNFDWEYENNNNNKNTTRIGSEPTKRRRRKVSISLPLTAEEICKFAIKLKHDDQGYYVSPQFGWAIHSHHPHVAAAASRGHNHHHQKKQKVSDHNDQEKSSSSIIHQDRNSRIQYLNDGNTVEFSLDLPGVRACDTKVEIRNGVLQVEAERKRPNHRTTKFQRSFALTDITDAESDHLQASLEDGVLRIILPKKVPVPNGKEVEEETVTLIPVEAGYPTTTNNNMTTTVVRSLDLPGVSLSNVTLGIEKEGTTISVMATRRILDRESTIQKSFTIDTNKVDAATLKGYLADGVLTVVSASSPRVVAPRPPPMVGVTTGPATNRIGEDHHYYYNYYTDR